MSDIVGIELRTTELTEAERRPRKICGYYMHLDPHFLRV